jgi:hypothetical protein
MVTSYGLYLIEFLRLVVSTPRGHLPVPGTTEL